MKISRDRKNAELSDPYVKKASSFFDVRSLDSFLKCFLWMLLFGLLSCEKVIDWELQPGDNGRLVVEAILTDENKIQELRLSTSYDAINEPTPAVTDAKVWVEVNGVTITFSPDSTGTGRYLSEVPFAVFERLTYTLQIDWRGVRYTASSQRSSVAPIPEITFERANNGLLRFDEGVFLYNPNQQAMYIMNLDWSHINSDSISRAKLVFYTFSSLEESELNRPDREEVLFPPGTIVTLRKYGLNEEFAAYLRALAIETEWNGAAFFSAPSSLPSNISNGGLGFFSTCAVVEEVFIAQ